MGRRVRGNGCAQKTAPDLISEGDGCCYDEDGELPEVLFFSQLSLINGAWKNTSQNTHDTIVSF